MLWIVRMHQGKAVRKHGRPLQKPNCSRCCEWICRPFVWASIKSMAECKVAAHGLWLWELSLINSLF